MRRRIRPSVTALHMSSTTGPARERTVSFSGASSVALLREGSNPEP